MRERIVCVLLAGMLALPCVGVAEDLRAPVAATRIVDLTQSIHEGMAYWPGAVPFSMPRLADYAQGYRLHSFTMSENTGTHLDAPAHFIEGGRPIDRLRLDELVLPAVVIDVTQQATAAPDYALSADDVRAWEAVHGTIPAGSLVLLHSGWGARFAEPERYVNADAAGVMHFPGYAPDAARLLLERDVAAIGIDTLSLDHGPSQDFATHHLMLGHGKYQIENLANLDRLPPVGATVIVGVLPVRDGTQAPARVFALLP